MRIVHISDTHSKEHELEALFLVHSGDVLVHSGDFGGREDGSLAEFNIFLDWLADLPHRNKILVSGNHDAYTFSSHLAAKLACAARGVILLSNEGVLIDGVLFSGLCLPFPEDWNKACRMAVTDPVLVDLPLGGEINNQTQNVSARAHVVIAHCPPLSVGDSPSFSGSSDLARQIALSRPEIVLCGHIHEGYGATLLSWKDAAPPRSELLQESPLSAGSSLLSSRTTVETNVISVSASHDSTLVVNSSMVTRKGLLPARVIDLTY